MLPHGFSLFSFELYLFLTLKFLFCKEPFKEATEEILLLLWNRLDIVDGRRVNFFIVDYLGEIFTSVNNL